MSAIAPVGNRNLCAVVLAYLIEIAVVVATFFLRLDCLTFSDYNVSVMGKRVAYKNYFFTVKILHFFTLCIFRRTTC